MSESSILSLFLIESFDVKLLLSVILLIILLIFSALVSGAEVAFFSLTPKEKKKLKKGNDAKIVQHILKLLQHPKKLLATILVVNNFLNIGIILFSSLIVNRYVDFQDLPTWAIFLIEVIGITFVLLLFGEVMPKTYAIKHALPFTHVMGYPLLLLSKLFHPLTKVLIAITNVVGRRIKRTDNIISIEDLSQAIDLTNDEKQGGKEHHILKRIVSFGSKNVRQVMRIRVDVISIEKHTSFEEVCKTILTSGHSRIPVYDDSFDKIIGILYVKDLLPHLKKKDFNWVRLLRDPLFVTENKKLDSLLKEFQEKKIHMAIVVDEYGATTGIITLEDVLEEIVGEITDEFDNDEFSNCKIDDNNYMFDGKIALNDVYNLAKISKEDRQIFESKGKEADSLAGLLIEVEGAIPRKNKTIQIGKYSFLVKSVDKRKVKKIKMTVGEKE